ncbi:hypothetical protein HETIRDRAFT_165270 [Heterobasidion irregulare TC 32-1]|uniref:Uncharacterized protein n=1 Tax=Heterobasidion irregulare (strain TC 32-1) TaxID=747525 RepID=W4K9G0_HETIT|nr:uncharacterized protein HETIRDRAFT_165270 [Heterobasidion irregulare TC 32-1]ETW82472.1 hypothetical protein HETIRDRAFT_165270 [Heterobasidion irregulare TC 32-1]
MTSFNNETNGHISIDSGLTLSPLDSTPASVNSEPTMTSTAFDSISGTTAALGPFATYEDWNTQVQNSLNKNGLVYIPFTSKIAHFKGQRAINQAFLLKLTNALLNNIANDIDESWLNPIFIIGGSLLADERLRQLGKQNQKEVLNWGIDGMLDEPLICADGQHRHLAGIKANKKGWYARIINRDLWQYGIEHSFLIPWSVLLNGVAEVYAPSSKPDKLLSILCHAYSLHCIYFLDSYKVDKTAQATQLGHSIAVSLDNHKMASEKLLLVFASFILDPIYRTPKQFSITRHALVLHKLVDFLSENPWAREGVLPIIFQTFAKNGYYFPMMILAHASDQFREFRKAKVGLVNTITNGKTKKFMKSTVVSIDTWFEDMPVNCYWLDQTSREEALERLITLTTPSDNCEYQYLENYGRINTYFQPGSLLWRSFLRGGLGNLMSNVHKCSYILAYLLTPNFAELHNEGRTLPKVQLEATGKISFFHLLWSQTAEGFLRIAIAREHGQFPNYEGTADLEIYHSSLNKPEYTERLNQIYLYFSRYSSKLVEDATLNILGLPNQYLKNPSNFHFRDTTVYLNSNTLSQFPEEESTWRSYTKNLATNSLVWYHLLLLLKFDLGKPLTCNPAMIIPLTPPTFSSETPHSQEASSSSHHLDDDDDDEFIEDDQSKKRKRANTDQGQNKKINKGKGKMVEKNKDKELGKGKSVGKDKGVGMGKGKGIGKGKGVGKGSIKSIKNKITKQWVEKIQKTDLVFIDPPEGIVVKDSPYEFGYGRVQSNQPLIRAEAPEANIAHKDCLDLLNQFKDARRLHQISRLLQTLLVTEAFQSELRKTDPQIPEPKEHQVACLEALNTESVKSLKDLKGHIMTKALREYVVSGRWADIHTGTLMVQDISEVDNDSESSQVADSQMDIDIVDSDMGTDNHDNNHDNNDEYINDDNSSSSGSSNSSSNSSSHSSTAMNVN